MVKYMHSQRIDDNEIIWRYMDFSSFYSLLLSRSLYFKRLDKFSDEYEGTLYDETKTALITHRLQFGESEAEVNEWVDNYIKEIEKHKVGILANSWSVSEDESYAMWKIYLRNSADGVAIKTTTGRLKMALSTNTVPIIIGKIKYEPLNISDITHVRVATNKRKAYGYEKELRALVFNQYKFNQLPNGTSEHIPFFDLGTSFSVSLDDLIDEIYVSPFSGEWFVDIVKSAIKLLLPSFQLDKIAHSGIKDR